MTSTRRRRRPGENRQRLLEAGVVEFGLRGYHGASTATIAARAEVPQPHVYASFSTKQELFLACVEAAVRSAMRAVPAQPPQDALRLVYQAVAAAGDEALREALLEALEPLRAELPRARLSALLGEAAASLLE